MGILKKKQDKTKLGQKMLEILHERGENIEPCEMITPEEYEEYLRTYDPKNMTSVDGKMS